MALIRRSGARFSANIWPGFVDAMTAILLVLMFVLSIFMIVQSILRDTISGQNSELAVLNLQLNDMSFGGLLEHPGNDADELAKSNNIHSIFPTGDEILVVGSDGASRSATVGRMKIESRPLILLRFKDENTNEGHVFIQQAETVRLVLENGGVCSVTDISVGDCILGCSFFSTRHVGQSISAPSKER